MFHLVEPIFISHYFIGVASDDRVIASSVLTRLQNGFKSDFIVKSSRSAIRPQGEIYLNWVAEIGESFSILVINLNISFKRRSSFG